MASPAEKTWMAGTSAAMAKTTASEVVTSAHELHADGAEITRQKIQRDVDRLFRANFERWTGPLRA